MSETTSDKECVVEMTSGAQVFETDKLNSKGGTEADAREMEMLGRTQVLNVSSPGVLPEKQPVLKASP